MEAMTPQKRGEMLITYRRLREIGRRLSGALVGEDPAGNMAVLISNLDADPSSYEVSFDGATGLEAVGE